MLTKTFAILAGAIVASCANSTQSNDADLPVLLEDAGSPTSGEDASTPQADIGDTDPNVVATVGPAARLEIDGTNVYWGEEFYDYPWAMFPRVVVKSISKIGGLQTTLAEFPALVAWSLGVDATNVYVGSGDRDDTCWMPPCAAPETLRAIPKAGGAVKAIAHCGAGQFASDDDSIFCGGWAGATEDSPSGILRVPVGQGSPVVLNDAHLVDNVTIYDADVFFGDYGILMRMPKTGGEPTNLYSRPLGGASALKVDSHFVFFVTHQRLYKVPRLGGEPLLLHTGAGPITSLDARDGHVFWTEPECLGVISSDGVGGRCIETQGKPRSVRVDDSAIFFIRDRTAKMREIVRLAR